MRSEREARLLASLNHPNIAAIYDIKVVDGNRCLILEYVEGETLAERLKRGAIPLKQTLEICRQIAEALQAAHRSGIVHRDIKPANIKVTPEGRVKVLDFGLAKLAVEQTDLDTSNAPTLGTQALHHAIAGTPAYMSPEQVRGTSVDARADIWAFGCLAYELLTGRPAFSGGSAPEIFASVLKDEPDWTALPADTPPKLRELVRCCLEKDPAYRLSGAAEGFTHVASPGASEQPRSLAVLPFVNSGDNPEMEYLSDGLTESIILNLSRLPELRVMARSTVFRFKGRSDEAQNAGRDLGVSAVLTGRVLQRGGMLLISAELVDVENGWQLWGDHYRRKSADIFAVEEDIAREISEKLRVKLSPERRNLLTRRYTENVSAYHLYLKGRFHWGKRTAEGLDRAMQYFRDAIEGDPTYALAYAGLAECYIPLGFYCHVAPRDAFPKARSAAEKALAIDPELGEAKAVLSAIKAFFDWDVEAGEMEARAAIALSPKYPRALQVLSESLSVKGQTVEAIAAVKQALELDPLSLHLNAAVTMIHHFNREFEQAVEQGRRTVELDGSFFPGHFYLGLALLELKQYSKAVSAFENATRLSNNSTLMLASLGAAFAFSGETERARNILRGLDDLCGQKYVSQTSVAVILTGLGEIDLALTWLERAYEHRCAWLLRCLATDPRLDRLWGEERFRSLCRLTRCPSL